MEEFKDIIGYEGLYQISNLGSVKSLEKYVYISRNNGYGLRKEKILKGRKTGGGYLAISLCSSKKKLKIHRLVAQAFLGLDINNPKIVVCHKDDNPENNRLENLFLGTQKDNMIDMKNKGKNIFSKIKFYKNVNQYDLEGNFIKLWIGIKEAGKYLGIDNSSITKACKGKYKQAGGFIWKYV